MLLRLISCGERTRLRKRDAHHGEKVSRWLAQPKTALQLLGNVLLLSVLAIGIASIR